MADRTGRAGDQPADLPLPENAITAEAVAVIAAHFHAATCRAVSLNAACDGAITADFELARYALAAALPHLPRHQHEANAAADVLRAQGAAAERAGITEWFDRMEDFFAADDSSYPIYERERRRAMTTAIRQVRALMATHRLLAGDAP